MAIRSWVCGFNMPSKETRYGDVEVIRSGKYTLIIDGGCERATDALISYLKRNKIKNVWLLLTHAHYDHWYGLKKILEDSGFVVKAFYCYDPQSLEGGLRDNKGSREVRKDINGLKEIIQKCKDKKVKVIYLKHRDKVQLGDIKFQVFRKQPNRVENNDDNGWAYVNDGSLCLYFYELYYWTSGDGSEKIYDFIKELGIKVKYFKIPHHGNNCPMNQANGLKSIGADICWYNTLEPNGIGTNDFTLYGARRCKQAGINVLTVEGDLNWVAKDGYFTIYKSGKKLTFKIPYKGKSEYKTHDANIVRKVLEGKMNKGDYRATLLLDAGYYPIAVQNRINLIIKIAKAIINGTMDFGKNEERIANLDKKYGKGYGQLIQDEINHQLNSKSKKW